jgi:hypothetical protein
VGKGSSPMRGRQRSSASPRNILQGRAGRAGRGRDMIRDQEKYGQEQAQEQRVKREAGTGTQPTICAAAAAKQRSRCKLPAARCKLL